MHERGREKLCQVDIGLRLRGSRVSKCKIISTFSNYKTGGKKKKMEEAPFMASLSQLRDSSSQILEGDMGISFPTLAT